MDRIAVLRSLRDKTRMPLVHLDRLLAELGSERAVLDDPRAYPKNTGDPFLACKSGFGVGRDHRGALYHRGCPESHGGPR